MTGWTGFGGCVMPEDWRSAVIVPCTRVKEKEMNARIIEILAC